MEASSDPLHRLMQALECKLCSQTFRDAVCFSGNCGHYFCRECVIATLEGPGISKSECPVCHHPGWKNELKYSYTVNNALVHAAGLSAEVQRGREAEACLRQRHGGSLRPSVVVAAATAPLPGSAGLAAAAAAPMHGEAGSRASKRKRRGRSVPEQHAGGGAPTGADEQRHDQQAVQQPPAGQQQQQQQQGEPWRERQPQRLWGRKKAAQPAPAQQQQQQQQQQRPLLPPAPSPAAVMASGAAATGFAAPVAEVQQLDDVALHSPVPMLYDSDWEQQARVVALGPATPEAVAVLEAEVALLQQALRLCDELPCLGDSQRQQQQAARTAERHAGAGTGAAGTSTAVLQEQEGRFQQQQAADEGQEVVIVPDTEEGGLLPSPPQPASAAADASPVPVLAAGKGQPATQQQLGVAHWQPPPQQQAQQQQQQQQRDMGQAPGPQLDRKRQLSGTQAAKEQQQVPQSGLSQEMDDEEGHRMSGRKRRKGGPGRAAPGSSRLGGSAAAAQTSAGAGAAAVQEQPAVEPPPPQPPQPSQPTAQDHGQPVAAQQTGRPSKAAVGEGDAVEVMWQADEELVPFVGTVLEVLPGGKHRIEYLDGEVATQDLDDEQWRLLLQEEYEEAEAEFIRQQRARGSPSQRSIGTSSSGEEHELSSGSEGGHSAGQQTGVGEVLRSSGAPLREPAAGKPAVSPACRSGAEAASGTAHEATGAAAAAPAAPAATPAAAAAAPAPAASAAPAPAASAAAAVARATLAQPQAAAAAAVKPKPAPGVSAADPYSYVSSTEAAGNERFQRFQTHPRRPQQTGPLQPKPQQALKPPPQPKQEARPPAARKRPLVPPPKFNWESSERQLAEGQEWQMARRLQHAGTSHSKLEQRHGRQQCGRKCKEDVSSPDSLPGGGGVAADGTTTTASAGRPPAQLEPQQTRSQRQQQPLARRPWLHDRPSMQQRRRRRAESEEEEEAAQQQAAAAAAGGVAGAAAPGERAVPAAGGAAGAGADAMDVVPSTQDAAGALFSMLREQQQPAAAAAAAVAAEPNGCIAAALPLQPTSRHNAAAGEVGFVSASQLPLAGDWEGDPADGQPQRRKQPVVSEQRHTSGKVLQHPGLFGPARAGRVIGRGGSALQDPGLFSQGSECSGWHAREAAAAGAGPAGAAAAASTPQAPAIRFADLFAGATASQAVWPSSSPEPQVALEGSQEAAAAAEAAAGHTPGGSCRRCIAVSGLNSEIQRKLLTLRARLGGLTLEEQVTERTTHVLVHVDDCGCVKQRSMQYLLALAHGCWAVSHGWVDACLEAGQWLPECQYEARGLTDNKDSMFVPTAARKRHAPGGGGGGPGLFSGRRLCLTSAPASSASSRGAAVGAASKVALVSRMVAAEGGTLVRAPRQGEGGGGRGAASPSPSPEGATLLVALAQGPQEARAAVKVAQKRYPGRPMYHQSWVFDSLCYGRCLDPTDYVMTEQRPLPTGARLGLSQQPSQAAPSQA